MPTIICSYCEYVGQGEDDEDRILDFVRRWNGDDICIQLMNLYSSCVDTATPEVYGTILGLHEKLETALAKI